MERRYVIYFIMRGHNTHNLGQLVVDWAEREKKVKSPGKSRLPSCARNAKKENDMDNKCEMSLKGTSTAPNGKLQWLKFPPFHQQR